MKGTGACNNRESINLQTNNDNNVNLDSDNNIKRLPGLSLKSNNLTSGNIKPLDKINLLYIKGVDYTYSNYTECYCPEDDYCRCSTIDDPYIENFNPTGLIFEYIKDIKKLSYLELFAIEKLFNEHDYDLLDFEFDIQGDYYGEVLDAIYLKDDNLEKKLNEFIALRKGRLNYLINKDYSNIRISSKIVNYQDLIENNNLDLKTQNQKVKQYFNFFKYLNWEIIWHQDVINKNNSLIQKINSGKKMDILIHNKKTLENQNKESISYLNKLKNIPLCVVENNKIIDNKEKLIAYNLISKQKQIDYKPNVLAKKVRVLEIN